jgi:DNA-binding response OmpR family regulator
MLFRCNDRRASAVLRVGIGLELCREIRRAGITTPVLMLTALGAVDDRVKGLEVGADDCLTKRFAFRELLARGGRYRLICSKP